MADLKGVEIFAEGVWNGNQINSDVLQNIVKGYEATKDFIKPVLKLGHNDSQDLLQKDGLPAAGWVSNLYIKGKKLFADFVDIPEKIFELIKKKAYRKVSVEIFNGYTFDGKDYPNLLGAVALLGADTPAVLTLNDILSRYKIDTKNFASDVNSAKIDIKIYSKDVEKEDFQMSDNQKTPQIDNKATEELQKKLDHIEAELKKEQEKNDSIKKEFSSKIDLLEKEKEKAIVERFSANLKQEGLISPSMEPFLVHILSSSKKLEFSINDKKYSTEDSIKELLKLAKETSKINKDEYTKHVEPPKTKEDGGKELESKIEEYMQKNKVSYSKAYREILKSVGA